jgi:hypothetical protein
VIERFGFDAADDCEVVRFPVLCQKKNRDKEKSNSGSAHAGIIAPNHLEVEGSLQQPDETRDNNSSYLSLYRVAEQKFVRLADASMREVRLLLSIP